MGNCLVTQLKGVVDNDNLPIFGAIILQVHEVENPTDGSQWFNFINDVEKTIDAEIVGDGYFLRGSSYAEGTNIGKTITGVNNTANSPFYYLSNGNYKVIIRNKYNINIIASAACFDIINLDEFAYNNITSFFERTCPISGNLAVLKNVDSLNITLNNSPEAYGDLKDIMTATRTVLQLFNTREQNGRVVGTLSDTLVSKDTLTQFDVAGNPGITGDISVLGQLTNLTHLYCFLGCSVTGTIESMVAAFRENGKTTGSLTTQVYDNTGRCLVTFNGNRLPGWYETTVLTWTATTITCNGVTIEA